MQTPANLISWILFLAFVILMLALDLGVFNRKARAVGLGKSLGWTAFWVGLAAGFAMLLYFRGHWMTGDPAVANHQLSLEFITGYLLEATMSVDNLFVFLLIFRYFKVPSELQHRVLFWGIVGAIAMRAGFIAAGVTLLNRFQWLTYLFGGFLIYMGARLLFEKKNAPNPADSFITRFARRNQRMIEGFAGGNFTLRQNGKLCFTTLALVLLVVETTDVLFAMDSIPAVLAVTRKPYIVFTSNIFAILGLRALYFVVAGLMDYFHLLHYGLAVVLVFVGAKMVGANYFEIPTLYTLGLIVAALASSVLLSLAQPSRSAKSAE